MQSKIKCFNEFGENFSFYIDNEKDLIQSRHAKGRLYEREELEIILAHCMGARVCLDIGANVGNHAIFMAKVLKAETVYVFEANPSAANVLRRNIGCNGLADAIDTSFLGIGVGAMEATMRVYNPQLNNLGAARLKSDAQGDIKIKTIDSLAINKLPDFVKIDVEGMEIDVLKGMKRMIAQSRPRIFIEVNSDNMDVFHQWANDNCYKVIDSFTRYSSSNNFFLEAE